MRFLRSLHVGDKFRVAHPSQSSQNGLPMRRTELFFVARIYPMDPGMYVTWPVLGQKIPRTLLPETPVLSPSEKFPSREEVEKFLLGGPRRRKVVGYRIIPESLPKNLSFLQPQEATLFSHLFLTGHREVSKAELELLLKGARIQSTMSPHHRFQRYSRHLAECGLIEEIVEEPATVVRDLRNVIGV